MKHKRKVNPRNNKLHGCSRRNFIRKIASTGVFSFLGGRLFAGSTRGVTADVYPPRTRIPNPYVNGEGKPLLVAVAGSDFISSNAINCASIVRSF